MLVCRKQIHHWDVFNFKRLFQSIIHNHASSSRLNLNLLQAQTVQNCSKQIHGWVWMWETTDDAPFTEESIIMDYRNVLMMDLFQLLSSPDVNWWTGLLWCFYQTLILTAPIHCRASMAETLMQWCISQHHWAFSSVPAPVVCTSGLVGGTNGGQWDGCFSTSSNIRKCLFSRSSLKSEPNNESKLKL